MVINYSIMGKVNISMQEYITGTVEGLVLEMEKRQKLQQ
jgi:hypothetical protein